jgi:uncharacterized membrane protein
MSLKQDIKLAYREHKEIFLVILAFCAILIPIAGNNSYWLDELYSVYARGIRYDGVWEHIKSQWVGNRSYPLYEVSLFIWMKVFGATEASTRILSVIYSAMAAIFLYLFVTKLLSKRVALLVTVLFLFSNMNIHYALETRYYSQMLMFTSLSVWLLLRYLEQLKGCSWRDLFYNKAFLWLSLSNAALILNHTFNYFFLVAQGLFLLIHLISMRSGEHILVITVKAIAVYLTPMLITALIWLPAYSTLYSPKATSYLRTLLHDSYSMVAPHIGWRFFILVGLLLLGLSAMVYLIKKRLTNVKQRLLSLYPRIDFYKWKVVSLFLLSGVAVMFLYITNYGFLGFFMNHLFLHPANIFTTAMLHVNLRLPEGMYVIIFILLVVVFFKTMIRLYRSNLNKVALTRRLFLLYFLFWLFVPIILIFLLLSFAQLDKFAPRYILFGLPAFMILLALVIEQALALLHAGARRLVGHSFIRLYVRYPAVWAVIFALILVWPLGYKALIRPKTDWRGISEQIVQTIEQDASLSYIVYETTFQDVPTLNYYLQRQSEHVAVGGVIQRREEDSIAMFESYRPRILRKEYRKVIEQHDYLLIAFTHQQEGQFPNTLELLSEHYKLESNRLAQDGRGFLLYNTRVANN